jgi:hypothetical protein
LAGKPKRKYAIRILNWVRYSSEENPEWTVWNARTSGLIEEQTKTLTEAFEKTDEYKEKNKLWIEAKQVVADAVFNDPYLYLDQGAGRSTRLKIPLTEQVASQLKIDALPEDLKEFVRLNPDQSLGVLMPDDNDQASFDFVNDIVRFVTGWSEFIDSKDAQITAQAEEEIGATDPEPQMWRDGIPRHSYNINEKWRDWDRRRFDREQRIKDRKAWLLARVIATPEGQEKKALLTQVEKAVEDAFFDNPYLYLDRGGQY